MSDRQGLRSCRLKLLPAGAGATVGALGACTRVGVDAEQRQLWPCQLTLATKHTHHQQHHTQEQLTVVAHPEVRAGLVHHKHEALRAQWLREHERHDARGALQHTRIQLKLRLRLRPTVLACCCVRRCINHCCCGCRRRLWCCWCCCCHWHDAEGREWRAHRAAAVLVAEAEAWAAGLRVAG